MGNLDLIRSAMAERDNMKGPQLAALTGIHSSLIGRYLRGQTAIGVKNAPKIAEALGLTASQVLFGSEAPSTEAA